MVRSFALTYAAVTLRLWLVALIFVQLPFLSGPDPRRSRGTTRMRRCRS
jgi:hypothetical protein